LGIEIHLQKDYANKSKFLEIGYLRIEGVKELPRNKKKIKSGGSRVRPRWTKEEVSLLKRLYRMHSNAEIAQILGRKVSSVVFKGHRLGLSKGARRLKEMGRENIRRRWEPTKQRSSKKISVSQRRTK
jgi:hypothetical protein